MDLKGSKTEANLMAACRREPGPQQVNLLRFQGQSDGYNDRLGIRGDREQ